MIRPDVDMHSPEAEALRKAAETLQQKSKSELMDAFQLATSEQRAAGMLNNAELDSVFSTVAPYLSDAQRQKMAQIFGELKR